MALNHHNASLPLGNNEWLIYGKILRKLPKHISRIPNPSDLHLVPHIVIYNP